MERSTGRDRGRPPDRLAIVLEATADLNEMLAEPDRLYASLLERLQSAVPYTSGSLQVVEGDASRIIAFRGKLDPEVVLGLSFSMDSLFPNYETVKTRKPVAYDDIREAYPHFWSRKEEFDSAHIRSWLGVPLIAAGTLIGMIALDRDEIDPFAPEEIRLVQGFADHAAVAVRNARTYRELQDALAARDALIRETNHRVKNNLQLVTGLIDLHAGNVSDGATRQCLEELKARIGTIASIHERLYRGSDFGGVDLGCYLRGLSEDVFGAFLRPGSEVRLETSMVGVRVASAAAVPLGLVACELIMNAMKYAFPGGSGVVSVRLHSDGRSGELVVADDGVGFDPGSADGFGLILARSLVEQVGGQASLESRPGRTAWTVRFPVDDA